MDKHLKTGLLTVCKLMATHDVKYMIVGGAAVALYGYYRHSINLWGKLTDKPDIDIWYHPGYDNYFHLLKVVEELGQDVSAFKNEQSPNPHPSFFKLDFDDFTLDFLPRIKADIKFTDAYGRKEVATLESISLFFLNYSDLVQDKTATARQKDIEDIEQLKNIRKDD